MGEDGVAAPYRAAERGRAAIREIVMGAQIISKATGAVTDVPVDAIDLDAPSIVRLDLDRSAVAAFEREGHDLV
ncbi:MAG: BapA prefix-like domain-containing protein, partial [Sphingomonas sp.]